MAYNHKRRNRASGTAKKSGLNPFAYFNYLFEALPNVNMSDEDVLKEYLPYSASLPASCRQPDANTNS